MRFHQIWKHVPVRRKQTGENTEAVTSHRRMVYKLPSSFMTNSTVYEES
jgi:hypothetical protein